ncbi:flavin reductase family protein [Acinetobacter sp. B5B]|uniref:flavin reductase family protein n=1 Tax=Acinetobacter baretiae TaxID=2605383 RepID=UPI0018C30EAE|nr:flavin reductase family protein [Acinetobacter baretiae]MBF7684127.1 flavin reductase family protein [Acinetobacter baretiae]
MNIKSVPLDKSYRLLNHGPTVLVSSEHKNVSNVMAASWACVLDFYPAKVTVVLDKATFTRSLVERSGLFALQIPVVEQVEMVMNLGTITLKNDPQKLKDCETQLFYQDGFSVPLVKGCAAWLICKLLPEEHNHQNHDLFIGEVIGAWADDRLFENGRWKLDEVPTELKTFHYMAGGQYYVTGQGYQVNNGP